VDNSQPAQLERFLRQIYAVNRDKRASRERPHKPAMLLALLGSFEAGEAAPNDVPFSAQLRQRFREIMEVVGKRDDNPKSAQHPFYHLAGDGFWTLENAKGGVPLYQPGNVGKPPTIGALKSSTGSFIPEVAKLLKDRAIRSQVADAIVARFFSQEREALKPVLLAGESSPGFALAEPGAPYARARDRAFSETVRAIYDHRCAACGLRILTDGIDFVDAAHLIPWADSHNDHPSNGVALCKNHHWAMDRHLLAPTPDHLWQVSARLDDRIKDNEALLELNGKPLIGPQGKGFSHQFAPEASACSWRLIRLLA
jgi:putative restriction endonuclease